MRWTPHALIEGCAIAQHAIQAEICYIYIRGEFTEPLRMMEQALADAYKNGVLGSNAMGSGKRIDQFIHRGAGAYICGEDIADSLLNIDILLLTLPHLFLWSTHTGNSIHAYSRRAISCDPIFLIFAAQYSDRVLGFVHRCASGTRR